MALSLPLPGRGLHYGNLVNRASPLNRGLVSWWLTLPQGGKGSTFFDIAGKNHGTLTNGASWGGPRGRHGGWGAIHLDGTNDYVSVPDNDILDLDMTTDYSFVITFMRLSHNTNDGLFAKKQSTASTHAGYSAMMTDGADVIIVTFHDGDGSARTLTSTTAFNDATRWYYVAWTYSLSETRARLYLDGVQEYTDNIVDISSCANSQPLVFGAEAGIVSPGHLIIDNIQIYRRLLGSSDLLALREESRRGYPTTLNRLRSYTVFDVGGAPPATNRRRRVLICGAAA